MISAFLRKWKNILFTLFKKWKVKCFFVLLFSKSDSEIPWDRDREMIFPKKSWEFSRNKTLVGFWYFSPNLSGVFFRILQTKWSEDLFSLSLTSIFLSFPSYFSKIPEFYNFYRFPSVFSGIRSIFLNFLYFFLNLAYSSQQYFSGYQEYFPKFFNQN